MTAAVPVVEAPLRTPPPPPSETARPYGRLAAALVERFLDELMAESAFPGEADWLRLCTLARERPQSVPSAVAGYRRKDRAFARAWETWLSSQLMNHADGSPARWIRLLSVPDAIRPDSERILPGSVSSLALSERTVHLPA